MLKKSKIQTKVDQSKLVKYITVAALAIYPGNKAGFFIIADYKDVDGKKRRLMIPASLANELRSLKKLLIDNCFAYDLSKEDWTDVQEILNKGSDQRMHLVENPGFHNGVYLLANNEIIGEITDKQSRPILDPTSKVPLPRVERKGTLEEWQLNVAVAALFSSRIMLSLAMTFSSYLLWILGIESGGIHLWGTSSFGKTTCQFVAISVQGSPGLIESWSFTETGAEELAAGHNDQLLVLDELKNLDLDPVKAAQKATKIIYTFSFGKDKRRSVKFCAERLTWRISFISSGELSLTEHAAEGGAKRLLGEEVRLIDVPADAGNDLGIYETIPSDISPAQFADDLQLNCSKYYGTPQQTFLEQLTSHMADDAKAVKEQIDSAMKEFMDEHGIDGSKGYEARMAKRFALAYAGGKLAVEFGILPFGEKEVMSGISKCYVDAINSRPKSDDKLAQEAYEVIDNELKQSKNFLDISSKGHGCSAQKLKNAWGYQSMIKGKKARVIKSETLKSLVPDERIMKKVLDIYVAEGRLVCDAAGKRTLQVKSHLKPSHMLPRAYCFLPKKKDA